MTSVYPRGHSSFNRHSTGTLNTVQYFV